MKLQIGEPRSLLQLIIKTTYIPTNIAGFFCIMQKYISAFLICWVVCMSQTCIAQLWNPKIGLIGSFTITQHKTQIQDGIFSISSRKGNYGFEILNQFQFGDNFAEAGIRYHHNIVKINAINQINVLQGYPYPFYWERRYECFSVPVKFGRKFNNNSHRIQYQPWVGFSVGILAVSYAKNGSSFALKKDPDNLDFIYLIASDSANPNRTYTFSSIDLGMNVSFPKALPRFSFGLFGCYQLNLTKPYSYTATAANVTTNELYHYSLLHSQRFIHGSLVVSYQLNKARASRNIRAGSLPCPPGVY